MKRIVFVCTGNTCRSPMAMAIFNNYAVHELGYEATSAGLSVFAETIPSANAVLAMKDSMGIDLTKHRAHELKQAEVEEAFLVLTMTLSQKKHILSMFPDGYQKVFALKEYAYDMALNTIDENGSITREFSPDIADPYGGSLTIYKLCALEIAQAVKKLVEILKKS